MVLVRAVGVLALFFLCSCAGKKPIDGFVDLQRPKVIEKSAYLQAEFDFWAALYEPSFSDLKNLRTAWIEHGKAFPESKAILNLEKELGKISQKIVIVALFMTDFEKADLQNKDLGWAVWPAPASVTELSSDDLVLRTLFPVNNTWARYYLLRYNPRAWDGEASQVVVSNRTSRIELPRVEINSVQ